MCQERSEEQEAATIELSSMVERVRHQTGEAEVTIGVLAEKQALLRDAVQRLDNANRGIIKMVMDLTRRLNRIEAVLNLPAL